MKKGLIILLLIISSLVGCTKNKEYEEVNFLVPYGIPFIAVGGLLDNDNIKIEVVNGPDLLISAIVSKSHDIIIAPINIGAKVFLNESSKYKLESIITFGNSYVISRNSTQLNDIKDLNSKDMMAYGKNATPDIILKNALSLNAISSNITYQSSLEQITAFFICNPDDSTDTSCSPPDYILSAEPVISKLEIDYKMNLNILDLQEYNDFEKGLIPGAGIFVNPNSLNQSAISEVLKKVESNIRFLNEKPSNYAKQIVDKHQYFKNLSFEVIEKSIPRSNIDYLKAKDNQDLCNEFFKMLNTFNIGLLEGKIPDMEFYRP